MVANCFGPHVERSNAGVDLSSLSGTTYSDALASKGHERARRSGRTGFRASPLISATPPAAGVGGVNGVVASFASSRGGQGAISPTGEGTLQVKGQVRAAPQQTALGSKGHHGASITALGALVCTLWSSVTGPLDLRWWQGSQKPDSLVFNAAFVCGRRPFI